MQNTNQLSVLAASWDRNLSHNLAKRRVWLRYWSWALILLLRSVPTSMFILCGTNSVNKFQQNCITIHRTRASRVNTSLWHKTYSLAYGGLFPPPLWTNSICHNIRNTAKRGEELTDGPTFQQL